jgi:YD repeat-containing protein
MDAGLGREHHPGGKTLGHQYDAAGNRIRTTWRLRSCAAADCERTLMEVVKP